MGECWWALPPDRLARSFSTTSTAGAKTRRPLKDGYYDHSQNCVEYIVLRFGPTAPTKKQTKPPAAWPRPSYDFGPHSWML